MSIISVSFRCIVQPVRRGILQVQVRFPPSAQGGKGRIEGLWGVGKEDKKGIWALYNVPNCQ
jgi:hypothetical protein